MYMGNIERTLNKSKPEISDLGNFELNNELLKLV